MLRTSCALSSCMSRLCLPQPPAATPSTQFAVMKQAKSTMSTTSKGICDNRVPQSVRFCQRRLNGLSCDQPISGTRLAAVKEAVSHTQSPDDRPQILRVATPPVTSERRALRPTSVRCGDAASVYDGTRADTTTACAGTVARMTRAAPHPPCTLGRQNARALALTLRSALSGPKSSIAFGGAGGGCSSSRSRTQPCRDSTGVTAEHRPASAQSTGRRLVRVRRTEQGQQLRITAAVRVDADALPLTCEEASHPDQPHCSLARHMHSSCTAASGSFCTPSLVPHYVHSDQRACSHVQSPLLGWSWGRACVACNGVRPADAQRICRRMHCMGAHTFMSKRTASHRVPA